MKTHKEQVQIRKLLSGRLLTKRELSQTFPDYNEQQIEELTESMEIISGVITHPKLQCQRCSNSNERLFSEIHSREDSKTSQVFKYCLNCIQMGRISEESTLYHLPSMMIERQAKFPSKLTWAGTLSAEQQRAADDLIESLNDFKRPHLVHAVTGSGKTEMIFPVIDEVLRSGGRAAIVSPRIDVCLELAPRLQAAFGGVSLCLLYGGASEAYRYTDIVVSTTHQLLRFKDSFDLVIVDEVDAFPYVDDETLHFAVKRAKKISSGKLIYLTATPDDKLFQQMNEGEITYTTLPARYHRNILPEPSFVWIGDWRRAIRKRDAHSKLWRLLMSFLQIEGVKIVFMPHIKLAEALHSWLAEDAVQFKLHCVHAKDLERKEKVIALRQNEVEGLISTTILERGVTFENCHVCIVGAEDRQYSKSALVQMSGRVGRKADYPDGTLIYAHYGKNRKMVNARQEIKQMNRLARENNLVNN